jgi:hypothetical protein
MWLFRKRLRSWSGPCLDGPAGKGGTSAGEDGAGDGVMVAPTLFLRDVEKRKRERPVGEESSGVARPGLGRGRDRCYGGSE